IDAGHSIILMDSKATGENMIEPYRNMAAIQNRLVWLHSDPSLALNPFDLTGKTKDEAEIARAMDMLLYLFEGLLQISLSPKQQTLFRNCLRGTLHLPNPNILLLEEILKHGLDRDIILPERVRAFFNEDYPKMKATVAEIDWRIELLIENPILLGML